MTAETRTTRLEVSERYPFVHETTSGAPAGPAVEVPQEQLNRWRKVMADFEVVQDEMEAAYDAGRARDAEATRLKNAEDAFATAQMRLDRARREQTHRPDNPASWAFIGDGDIPCDGIQYVDEKDARAERMRLHKAWPGITFDIKPYRCAHGHHHLGRSS